MVHYTIRPFEYFEPKSIREAINLLEKYGEEAKVIAGGTALVPQLKARRIEPKYLVDISRIENLNYIENDNGNLRIGATTTHNILKNSALVLNKTPVLVEAVGEIGSVQVQNLGTIGGNLVNASPAADTAPPLIALDSLLKVVGPMNERLIPVEDFFISSRKTALKNNELLTEIQIPYLSKNTGSAFMKIGRRAGHDLSVSSVAVKVTMERDICEDTRIALGSVAPTPIRVKKTEDYLKGKQLDEDALAEASEIVAKEICPSSNIRGSAEYKVEVSKVLFRKTMNVAISRRS